MRLEVNFIQNDNDKKKGKFCMMGVQISIEKLATIYYVKVNTSSLCHHLCVSFGSEEHKGKMGHFNDNFDYTCIKFVTF